MDAQNVPSQELSSQRSSAQEKIEEGYSKSSTKSTRSKESASGSAPDEIDNESNIGTLTRPANAPDPSQLFYLSLIEGRCRTQAKEHINSGRHRDDLVPEDHPEVTAFAEQLFNESYRELIKIGFIPQEVSFPDIKELRRYLATFDNRLNDIVKRQPSISFADSNFRAIESYQDYTLSEFGETSIFESSQPQALVTLPGDLSASPLRSLMYPTNGRHQESTYHRKFEEICLLGKGGFGQVFRVRHILDQQEYAVKKIRVSASQLAAIHNEFQLQDLLNELRALAKLQHRNVVRYYDSWLEQSDVSSRSMGTRQHLLDDQEYDSKSSETDFTSSSEKSIESGFQSLQIGQLEVELKREERKKRRSSFLNLENNYDVVFEDPNSPALGSSRPEEASTTPNGASLFLKPSEMSDDDEDIEEIERAAMNPQMMKNEKDWVIFIQMAPYPITLEDYVWSEQQKSQTVRLQHCFHIPNTARILLEILEGVDYIHSHQIVHRDLKPSNIFLSVYTGKSPPDGSINITSCRDCGNASSTVPQTFVTPHIGDFGLIAKLDESPPVHDSESFRPSPFAVLSSVASSKQPGTKYYRAPNIDSKSQFICPKLDIYSLGVIAYELLVKFGTKSERHVVLDRLSSGSLDGMNGHAMENGIKGMLCSEREARWDSGKVRSWLLGFVNGA
ncbi:hypothetical protein HYALB_00011871 [Hymenoscyphus albidus]|uniref:non-specific serine/threonine protein kinase n=1 Tax=Hymenoscyphus albidus TaxID=595503 RepID=A0A9N9Q6Y6_9HELO|nr:hypothetical protein HYALB_00011871 [Hymenoscyphus albidus]